MGSFSSIQRDLIIYLPIALCVHGFVLCSFGSFFRTNVGCGSVSQCSFHRCAHLAVKIMPIRNGIGTNGPRWSRMAGSILSLAPDGSVHVYISLHEETLIHSVRV